MSTHESDQQSSEQVTIEVVLRVTIDTNAWLAQCSAYMPYEVAENARSYVLGQIADSAAAEWGADH